MGSASRLECTDILKTIKLVLFVAGSPPVTYRKSLTSLLTVASHDSVRRTAILGKQSLSLASSTKCHTNPPAPLADIRSEATDNRSSHEGDHLTGMCCTGAICAADMARTVMCETLPRQQDAAQLAIRMAKNLHGSAENVIQRRRLRATHRHPGVGCSSKPEHCRNVFSPLHQSASFYSCSASMSPARKGLTSPPKNQNQHARFLLTYTRIQRCTSHSPGEILHLRSIDPA